MRSTIPISSSGNETSATSGAASTLVSQEAFDDAARLRPDIEHIVIEGADHYIPEELPDVVCASITRLLG